MATPNVTSKQTGTHYNLIIETLTDMVDPRAFLEVHSEILPEHKSNATLTIIVNGEPVQRDVKSFTVPNASPTETKAAYIQPEQVNNAIGKDVYVFPGAPEINYPVCVGQVVNIRPASK